MTHFRKNTLPKKILLGPYIGDSSGNVLLLIQTKILRLNKFFKDGNYHNFLNEEDITHCYYFKETTFSIGAIKNKVIIGKLGHSACQ